MPHYSPVRNRTLIFKLSAWVSLAALLSSCGEVPQFSDESTDCPAGTAQIMVQDAFLQVLCGCQGTTNGTQFPPGTPLTCTVNSGETVWFRFEATDRMHQVVSTGVPAFNASNVIYPARSSRRIPYPVTFDTPGIYPFADLYLPTLSGDITVL